MQENESKKWKQEIQIGLRDKKKKKGKKPS